MTEALSCKELLYNQIQDSCANILHLIIGQLRIQWQAKNFLHQILGNLQLVKNGQTLAICRLLMDG